MAIFRQSDVGKPNVFLLLIVYSSSLISPLNKRHIFFSALIGISQRAIRTIGMRMSIIRMNLGLQRNLAHGEHFTLKRQGLPR